MKQIAMGSWIVAKRVVGGFGMFLGGKEGCLGDVWNLRRGVIFIVFGMFDFGFDFEINLLVFCRVMLMH